MSMKWSKKSFNFKCTTNAILNIVNHKLKNKTKQLKVRRNDWTECMNEVGKITSVVAAQQINAFIRSGIIHWEASSNNLE